MGSNSAGNITMPRTFWMVGLWQDLKIDLSPIPVKEVTNLCVDFRSGNPGIYFLSRINYAHIYTWTHANAHASSQRKGLE